MSTNISAQWLDSGLLRLYFGNSRIIFMTSDELVNEINVYCCSPTLNVYCDVIFGLAHKQLTMQPCIFAVPAAPRNCTVTLSYNQLSGRLQYINSTWDIVPVSHITLFLMSVHYHLHLQIPLHAPTRTM